MKGSITIGRTTGGSQKSQENPIYIEVRDETSRTRFLELRMTLEGLAEALTGMSCIPCEFELRASEVGKVLETKTELVPRHKEYKPSKEQVREHLKEWEVDGWVGYDDDLSNHHKRHGDKQAVSFRRYVDVKP